MSERSRSIQFGTPAGVTEGQWFKSHDELYAAGVHRFRGRGISGVERTGADSIVLSGGYEDDRDEGDLIVYTGEGGRNRDSGQMEEDQSISYKGNAALVVSQAMGHPVRVIEGLGITNGKRRRATKGYRYRGLYRISDHWLTVGQAGFVICQFRLHKIKPGMTVEPQAVDPQVGAPTDLEEQVRRYIVQSRLVRDSSVVRAVKEMYKNTCQICNLRLVVSPDGEAYSEAAHIQALGKPHLGEDKIENVLCLCPSCHVLFDRGALHLTDEFNVIDGLTGQFRSVLARVKGHNIGLDFARKHRERWAGRFE
ncbi:YDG/SRA domain-containing protein [Streptomyces sp. NBC_01565]|uniref:YDG/SRA domain-containing protein n=1 Tax=unclassified Streptomyces TaxID=2593676 RepID=UPI00224DD173|nr:YDG/SRA domain-containing protein [Streptomyces sp. NBC_01565]MCX4543394.1 HNH endonuclease [Streptomyces sp. NBC_01565]